MRSAIKTLRCVYRPFVGRNYLEMGEHPLRVLIVDDSADDAELIVDALRRGGYCPLYRRVDTPEAFAVALREVATWDLITCDSVGPRLDLARMLAIAHEIVPEIPIVHVSGRRAEELRGPLERGDVSGFLSKDRLPDLPALVAGLIPRRAARAGSHRVSRRQGPDGAHG
jgi:CheY-like chemotaxis protein